MSFGGAREMQQANHSGSAQLFLGAFWQLLYWFPIQYPRGHETAQHLCSTLIISQLIMKA